MTSDAPRVVRSLTGLAGALGAIAVDAVYLAAIAQQGVTPPGGRVMFVALWIVAAGLIGLLGAFRPRPRVRGAMLGASAAMLVTLGVPAVFSIGIPLMLCAGLLAAGAVRAAQVAKLPVWLGIAGPVVLVLAAGLGVATGFALTDF